MANKEKYSPLVSIIIPVYNSEQYIGKCLESVICQAYSRIEVIIINDGSTDNSIEVIRRCSERDSRVKVYSQENKGVSAARNTGIEKASGEYTLFIDSDDWVEPDMVSKLVELTNGGSYDFICCNYEIGGEFNSNRDDGSVLRWDHDELLKVFLIHRTIKGSLCNKLIRTSLYKQQRFDANVSYGEDAQMIWRIIQNVEKGIHYNKILYHVSVHDDSTSGGGYRESKLSCISVWSEVVACSQIVCPQYIDLARARLGENVAVVLYYFYHDGLKQKVQEQEMIVPIKKYKRSIMKDEYISKGLKFFCWLVASGSLTRACARALARKMNR